MVEIKGKKIIVTGGASFIGSHLVETLILHYDCDVTILDDFSSGTRLNLESIQSNKLNIVECDLRDYQSTSHFVGHQFVFHLANIHGGRGFIDTHPAQICQNFIIDGNVFKASLEHGIEQVIYTSSACSYPTNLQTRDPATQRRYLSEEMADPFKHGCALADGEYGWAKLMGEMQLKSYYKQYGLNGVSCRLFTVYGPRENESHAIIAFIAKALIKQDPYEIWGSGEQDRNFTYVTDVVEGLIRSAQNISDCRAVNIGTDEIIKIKDAAKIVCDITGHTPSRWFFDDSKPEGVHARAASIQNQLKWLDWSPQVSFEIGIKLTIEWYEDSFDKSDFIKNYNARLFER